MQMFYQRESNTAHTDEDLPDRNKTVIIITPEFRCLGYLDDEGKWRARFGNREL